MNPEPIPISALEHWSYCPRQCALILVDGVWSDNEHTVRGERGHRRADTYQSRVERGVTVITALPLWSERLGLAGRADAVEVGGDGSIRPVEYKIGVRHGDAAAVQLCAQALCLEEMTGVDITVGYVWFSGPRRRHTIHIDAALRQQTIDACDRVRQLLDEHTLPAAPNDSRCSQCQLLAHCLPDLVSRPAFINRYIATEVYSCGC